MRPRTDETRSAHSGSASSRSEATVQQLHGIADLDLEAAVLVGIATGDLVHRLGELHVDDFHGDHVDYFRALSHLVATTGIHRETIIRIGDIPTDLDTAVEEAQADSNLRISVAIEVVGFEDALRIVGASDPIRSRLRFHELPRTMSIGMNEQLDRLVRMRRRREKLPRIESVIARYYAGDDLVLRELDHLLGIDA